MADPSTEGEPSRQLPFCGTPLPPHTQACPRPLGGVWVLGGGASSVQGRLEEGDDGVFVVGDHQDAAELVEERFELRTPHVLVVHDLLQVVVSPKVVQ